MHKHLYTLLGVLLIGLGVAQGALATITTLTFDEFSSGTDITNQYAGIGRHGFWRDCISGAQLALAGQLGAEYCLRAHWCDDVRFELRYHGQRSNRLRLYLVRK